MRPVGEQARVLRLITRLNVGGPARQALLLTRELAEEFPTVLAAGRPAEVEGELSDPAVKVRYLPLVRPIRLRHDLAALAAARRLVAQTQPELVHTHMAKAGALGRLATLGRASRPRLVHTFHGHVLDGYFPKTQQRAFIAMERWLARHTDVLVAVSPEVRDELLALRIGRPSQFHVISLGLDLASFLQVAAPTGCLRARLGLPDDAALVGVVGRLVPIKDHVTLLAAIALLPGVHLAIIGDGELRQQLRDRATELGIAARVHFVGWWLDVADAMSDLDVVALTSRNEGTPVALIEALASGRAVVATDVGGVRHVVTHGIDGLLNSAGDETGIAASLAALLADPVLRARMGAAGRTSVEDRFGHRRLVADMAELYRALLGPDRRCST